MCKQRAQWHLQLTANNSSRGLGGARWCQQLEVGGASYATAGNDILHHRAPATSGSSRGQLDARRRRCAFVTLVRKPWRRLGRRAPAGSASSRTAASGLTDASLITQRIVLTCSLDWIVRIFLLHLFPLRSDLLPNSLERSKKQIVLKAKIYTRHAHTEIYKIDHQLSVTKIFVIFETNYPSQKQIFDTKNDLATKNKPPPAQHNTTQHSSASTLCLLRAVDTATQGTNKYL